MTTIAATPLPILEWLLITAVATIGAWLAVYDFRERRLPNRLVWPLYAVTGVLVASCGLVTGDFGRVGIAVLAGAALWAIYFVLGLLGAVAYGDVKLAGALALALGWWGIIPALLGAAAAYVLALPHAAIHAAGRRGRQIPFGPYMVAGTVAVALWQILTTS
ncbi:hypothetical protein CSIV_00470 [Microbacterium sp. CSI-V]|nr:hypothetical protein CSIV_00470 [Microbacterium sp. CSI-V]